MAWRVTRQSASQILPAQVLPTKSEIAEAIHAEPIRHRTNRWNGLTCCLVDGRIKIEFNTVDRGIRPIALNRTDTHSAGSDEGGANWAIGAILIATCRRNAVNPHVSLADTPTKLVNGWPVPKTDDFTLWPAPRSLPDPSTWARGSAYEAGRAAHGPNHVLPSVQRHSLVQNFMPAAMLTIWRSLKLSLVPALRDGFHPKVAK